MRSWPDIRRTALAAVPWTVALHVAAALALLVGLWAFVDDAGTPTGLLGAAVRYLLLGLAAVLSLPGIALGAVLAAVTRTGEQRVPLWIGFGAVVPLVVALGVLAMIGATTPVVLVTAVGLLLLIGALLALVLRRRQAPPVS